MSLLVGCLRWLVSFMFHLQLPFSYSPSSSTSFVIIILFPWRLCLCSFFHWFMVCPLCVVSSGYLLLCEKVFKYLTILSIFYFHVSLAPCSLVIYFTYCFSCAVDGIPWHPILRIDLYRAMSVCGTTQSSSVLACLFLNSSQFYVSSCNQKWPLMTVVIGRIWCQCIQFIQIVNLFHMSMKPCPVMCVGAS